MSHIKSEPSVVCEPGPALKLFQANNVHLIRLGSVGPLIKNGCVLFCILSGEVSWHPRISQQAWSRYPDEQQLSLVLAWHMCVSYDVLIAQDQVMVALYCSLPLGK